MALIRISKPTCVCLCASVHSHVFKGRFHLTSSMFMTAIFLNLFFINWPLFLLVIEVCEGLCFSICSLEGDSEFLSGSSCWQLESLGDGRREGRGYRCAVGPRVMGSDPALWGLHSFPSEMSGLHSNMLERTFCDKSWVPREPRAVPRGLQWALILTLGLDDTKILQIRSPGNSKIMSRVVSSHF